MGPQDMLPSPISDPQGYIESLKEAAPTGNVNIINSGTVDGKSTSTSISTNCNETECETKKCTTTCDAEGCHEPKCVSTKEPVESGPSYTSLICNDAGVCVNKECKVIGGEQKCTTTKL